VLLTSGILCFDARIRRYIMKLAPASDVINVKVLDTAVAALS